MTLSLNHYKKYYKNIQILFGEGRKEKRYICTNIYMHDMDLWKIKNIGQHIIFLPLFCYIISSFLILLSIYICMVSSYFVMDASSIHLKQLYTMHVIYQSLLVRGYIKWLAIKVVAIVVILPLTFYNLYKLFKETFSLLQVRFIWTRVHVETCVSFEQPSIWPRLVNLKTEQDQTFVHIVLKDMITN